MTLPICLIDDTSEQFPSRDPLDTEIHPQPNASKILLNLCGKRERIATSETQFNLDVHNYVQIYAIFQDGLLLFLAAMSKL